MKGRRNEQRVMRVGTGRREAFTLIELLVTVSIIGLLLAILVPSLKVARDRAKITTTAASQQVIATGLTLFKSDNEKAFPRTNGFPESAKAEDPATEGPQDIYGAQWLVRSLVGKDFLGFIPRRIVPKALQNPVDVENEQVTWYRPDSGIDRIPPYVPVERLKTIQPVDLPGTSDLTVVFPPPAELKVPVFIDAWGLPILYYAAATFGNSLCPLNSGANTRPFYNHEDNEIFTGSDVNDLNGWIFTGRNRHKLYDVCPNNPDLIDNSDTFGRYIHDERVHEAGPATQTQPRPINRDTYILISAGPDKLYGTTDDVNNLNK